MIALFNKEKTFIGYGDNIPPNSKILKKDIDPEKTDLGKWKWEGDYDSGKMVPIKNLYPIEELNLEKELFEYINKNYPIEKQIYNLIKQINIILENNNELLDEEYSDMSDYITSAFEKYENRVKYHKDKLNLISKNESEQTFRKIFG
jgi:hypothetical protein